MLCQAHPHLCAHTRPWLGYSIAAFPLDLINASIVSMRAALEGLKQGRPPQELSLPFEELQEVVGFKEYYAEEAKYKV